MIRSGWLAVRALVAIALMVGFYTLAAVIASGLFYIPYAEWVYVNRIDRLAILCIAGGGMILWSLVPRHQKFVAPGPELRPADQPRLFERLNKLALSIGQPMPSEVYLIWDLNAWVAQVHKATGLGSKRVMGIGLPLLQVVTVSQFEAVLAHEFGHYHGGDTALGPWIYKTRGAIGRTVQNLSNAGRGKGWFGMLGFLQYPFIWYGKLFLRITHAISRAQELSADRLAANTVGAEPLSDGLRAIHRAAPASSYFFQSEVLPVVRSGFAPPLVEGFAGFLRQESIAKQMDKILKADLTAPQTGAYDTHPPLAQRLAALKGMAKAKAPDDSPALSLIENLPRVESQLTSSWLTVKSRPLKPIQ
jgi:Zn-dependent protease with chaperone function